MKTKPYITILGVPKTIGELKSMIGGYSDDTPFGFRNQPMQQLQEIDHVDDVVYVVFVEQVINN